MMGSERMTRSERRGHRVVALLGMMAVIGTTAAAQQTRTLSEPAELRIRSALRAFYFSLAHHDWEALTAGILPAKVVAHHPAPAAIVAASQPHERPAGCPPTVAERVEDAEITIDTGWAAASVARCGASEFGANEVGTDEFRFTEFDGRWWIVHIDLSHDPEAVRLAR
jgi:hypothetical protein